MTRHVAGTGFVMKANASANLVLKVLHVRKRLH